TGFRAVLYLERKMGIRFIVIESFAIKFGLILNAIASMYVTRRDCVKEHQFLEEEKRRERDREKLLMECVTLVGKKYQIHDNILTVPSMVLQPQQLTGTRGLHALK
ncbi:hypothetical protein EK904_005790, partial [Melospiza melodia maxima]